MVPDGRYVAVVDRFEGDRAVLLVEDGDEVVGDVAVPAGRLPPVARRPDVVLSVRVADGDIAAVTYDPVATVERRGSVRAQFDRLARRPPDDDEG